jgi:uncharacterized RDD family membrane protein YckC
MAFIIYGAFVDQFPCNKVLERRINSTFTSMSNTIPGVSDRVKAFIIDGVVTVIFMFAAFKIIDSFQEVTALTRRIVFLSILLVYDPLFTTLFGGTIGHRSFNLRVKRGSNSEKNIWLIAAVFRFAVKVLLGWISLLTISSNSKGQAIHDILTGSVVIYKKQNLDNSSDSEDSDVSQDTDVSEELDQLSAINKTDKLEDSL